MTSLPEDSWLHGLRPQPAKVTAAEYKALPEEVCRSIEIVDGYIVFSEAPTRRHQTAARLIANMIATAIDHAMAKDHERLEVNADVDLRIQDIPLVNRRPDIVLYRCLDDEEPLRPLDVLLIIEIVSPGSETAVAVDKFGEYARAGIPHYWIVRLDTTGVASIERYQLDRGSGLYKHIRTFIKDAEPSMTTVTNPISVEIDWKQLTY